MKQQELFVPELGDLLMGGKLFNSEGIQEWFEFPRYKVVAHHMDGEQMFLETLNPKGEKIGLEIMSIDSKQWRFYNEC